MAPLAIDLFCGLGGWTEGLLEEGYRVVGFDIERHRYPARDVPVREDGGKLGVDTNKRAGDGSPSHERSFNEGLAHIWRNSPLTGGWAEYPAQLVIQDVLTLHGAQFKDAALIVASPPCQAYSYRAMPWKRAKALPPPDNSLFAACFRIQREACAAAGRFIPLVVENVRGAQPWVGRSRWNFGSFHLWGDVPALMPIVRQHIKVSGFRFDGSGQSFQSAAVEGVKGHGGAWFKDAATADGTYGAGNFRVGVDGRKQPGLAGMRQNGKGDRWFQDGAARHGSRRSARKAASAQIAKIPLPLSRHIARAWYPEP